MRRNAQKATYWRDILKRQAASGLSVRRFCLEQDLSEASFYGWRKKLARQERDVVDGSLQSTTSGSANSASGGAFIPLTVGHCEAALEIVHPVGYRVCVTGQVDNATLQQVFDVLDERDQR